MRRRFATLNARRLAGIFICAAALLLHGCAAPQTKALRSAAPPLPARIELADVPYFAQQDFQCGPATLAMALGAAGIAAQPEALAPQVYLPGRHGSLQIEMLAATRRHGMLAYELQPRLSDLLGEVADGRPVVVLQNLALQWWPLWHYAVVIGYDLERGEILLRSGPQRREAMPLNTFEHTWSRGGYWALLVLPPQQLPHGASEDRYVAAALALEQVRETGAARSAYATALTRWPDNLAALMGLGNTAYAQRDFAAAEAAFRTATQRHPRAAAAFNNLADTLAQQQKYGEALAMARTAVALGAADDPVPLQTLREIEALAAPR